MKLFLIGMHICIVLHRTFKGSPRETASKRVNKFFKCSLDKKGFSVSKKRVLLANPLMVRKHAVVRTFVMFLHKELFYAVCVFKSGHSWGEKGSSMVL